MTSADEGGEVEEQAHEEFEAVKNDMVEFVVEQYDYLSVQISIEYIPSIRHCLIFHSQNPRPSRRRRRDHNIQPKSPELEVEQLQRGAIFEQTSRESMSNS